MLHDTCVMCFSCSGTSFTNMISIRPQSQWFLFWHHVVNLWFCLSHSWSRRQVVCQELCKSNYIIIESITMHTLAVSLLKPSSYGTDILSCDITCYFYSGSSVSLWPVPIFMSSGLSLFVLSSCPWLSPCSLTIYHIIECYTNYCK